MSDLTFEDEQQPVRRPTAYQGPNSTGQSGSSGSGMTKLLFKMGIKSEKSANNVLIGITITCFALAIIVFFVFVR